MQPSKTLRGLMEIADSHQQVIVVGQNAPGDALVIGSGQRLHQLIAKLCHPQKTHASDAAMLKVRCRDVEESVFHTRVRRPMPWPMAVLSISQQFVTLSRTEFLPSVHGQFASVRTS
jgi:hypothetical protein